MDTAQTSVRGLEVLKEKLREKFPAQVFDYTCRVSSVDHSTGSWMLFVLR